VRNREQINALARERLSVIVQRRAASSPPCDPLGDCRRGRQHRLIRQDRLLLTNWQSFEKDNQRPLDRPPVIRVRLP